jgi:hypothetical protein
MQIGHKDSSSGPSHALASVVGYCQRSCYLLVPNKKSSGSGHQQEVGRWGAVMDATDGEGELVQRAHRRRHGTVM